MKSEERLESLLEELIEEQKKRLLATAQRIIPAIVLDDLWQPNDFPLLEQDPLFRYEEGVLHGTLAAQTAIRSLKKN